MSNTEHPAHYNATKYEVWDVLDAWFPTNPTLWNVGKYLARADRKGGVEDLKKAKVYLEREIERREAIKPEIEERKMHCDTCGRRMRLIETIPSGSDGETASAFVCDHCAKCPTSPHMITR